MDELSDREAALIEAARRELAARASPKPAPGPISGPATGPIPGPGPAPGAKSPLQSPAPAPAMTEGPNPATAMHRAAPPAARPDAAERIAALMQAEKKETFRRKKRLLQYGIVIPAVFLIAAVIWVAAAIFRYTRI
jgi:hypothetical protein